MTQFAATLLVIFFAIGLHEYAHAKVADLAGDPTPRYMGRVTLNLFKHFDPLGTIMIIFTSLTGVGIGWGKPVMVNPSKMKNPRWDHFMSVLAGPATNILQAMFFAIVLRIVATTSPYALVPGEFLHSFLIMGVVINIGLAVFNMIPFGPLDGHWLLGYLMPEQTRLKWFMFNRTVGGMILIGIILFGQLSGLPFLSAILLPPIRFLFELFTGTPLQ